MNGNNVQLTANVPPATVLALPRKHSRVAHVFSQAFDVAKTIMPGERILEARAVRLDDKHVIEYCKSLYSEEDLRIGLFVCEETGLHTDDVAGNFTVGFVFQGDHQLRSSRSVLGALRPGSIFLLDNTKRHAAFKVRPDSPRLIFAAHDFDAACMTDALRHAQHIRTHFCLPNPLAFG